MLAEIYNWFTEGFDTADLKDAKALLDELSERRRRCAAQMRKRKSATARSSATNAVRRWQLDVRNAAHRMSPEREVLRRMRCRSAASSALPAPSSNASARSHPSRVPTQPTRREVPRASARPSRRCSPTSRARPS